MFLTITHFILSGTLLLNKLIFKLIVDDNNFNIFTMRTILETKFKLTALTAFSGEEAIEIFKERM